MKLIIDSRENSTLGKLIERKANKMGIQTEKKWLEVGDYVIGDVCFEAKSAVDFMQSILNKRRVLNEEISSIIISIIFSNILF